MANNMRLVHSMHSMHSTQSMQLYTDASIRSRIGIGGYMKAPQASQAPTRTKGTTFSYGINGKRDINRAELAAIYVGMLVLPKRDNIEILSDSLTAINLIKGKNSHAKFQFLVTCIHYVALQKFGGNVLFGKVKGHSGVYGNEVAHQMARYGTETDVIFHMPDMLMLGKQKYDCVDTIVDANVLYNGCTM